MAFAQTAVYRTGQSYSNSYGPTGATGAFQGQPGVGSWVKLPERGSQVILAGNTSAVLSGISAGYLCVNDFHPGGSTNEKVNIRIYRQNGTNYNGNVTGQPYQGPNTLLWTSPDIPVYGGDRTVYVPIPNIDTVGSNITITYQFDGGEFLNVPFDPADPGNTFKAGGRFVGAPVTGTLPVTPPATGGNGLVWRRVFTSSGPSDWAVQERPGTLAVAAWGFNFMLWSGNMSNLAKGYDNVSVDPNAPDIWAYYGLPSLGGAGELYDATGVLVALEGSRDKISSIDVEYYADTFNQTSGTPTFVVEVRNPVNDRTLPWGAVDGSGAPGTLIGASAPQPITLGLGTGTGSGEYQSATVTFSPALTVPAGGEVQIVFRVNGLLEDDTVAVGPGMRPGIGGAGQTGTMRSGNTQQGIYFRDKNAGSTWDGPFIFNTANNTPAGNFVDCAMQTYTVNLAATAGPQTVAPDALTLQRGQIISGTIANLAADDNVALRLKKFFVANPVEPFVWGTLQGTTSILTPSSVTFRVKSRMVTGGQFRQELEQWNWNTSSYENLLNTNPFNTVYGTRESIANPATGKVNGSGRLQARIRTFPNGISANPLPEVDWDLVNWIVNP
jgi:hypothetical protein